MSLQKIAGWLVAALCASVAVMVFGARHGLPALAAAAAALFAAAMLVVGLRMNRPLWALPEDRITSEAAPVAARRNSRLMAITFAWGAAAMFAVYSLTGLRWYHAWQYGSAMALLAVLAFGYGLAIGRTEGPSRRRMLLLRGLQLTVIQALAAAGGVLFLIVSGKLMTMRSDWAANQVFLFGGLAIAGLSVMAAVTQRRLMRRS
jgi:MFS family permease